jgi:GH15 family glucan-1,4-alpha-glucosidase
MTQAGKNDRTEAGYPDIADYAYLSDCHSAALVGPPASIDWCCMPRVDSGSVFGRLLDRERGGYCDLRPTGTGGDWHVSREYVDGSLVLETTFQQGGNEARVFDCLTMTEGGAKAPRRELLRVVEGRRGTMEFSLRIAARFDYGRTPPWLRRHGTNLWSATGGDDALVIAGDAPLGADGRHDLGATFRVAAGSRVRLSMSWHAPEDVHPSPPEPPAPGTLDAHLDETIAWWRNWCSGAKPDLTDPGTIRSAIVLKGLTNAPTGAVAAAPTTSLPEAIGGSRNWDYRYSWVRDSQFAVRSLAELGFDAEADGFRRFIERSAAGSADALQVMYDVGGGRRITEECLDLDGYRGSRPVRAGNAAAVQCQLDIFGYLLDLSWRWHQRGHSPDDDYWRFLLGLVDRAADLWRDPDRGIWEQRGDPQHFVHSKAMCWVAVDRGIQLAEACLRTAPLDRWRSARDAIRASVEKHGYDPKRNTFVRAYGSGDLDAALLLLPVFDFVAYDDERMVGTADAIARELDDGGLLRRYNTDDGLDGKEGAFVACAFWLVECYARQARLAEAEAVFDRAMSTANGLGLFSEEYDPGARQLLGNFPQALTHLSHIAAVAALDDARRRPGGS